MQNQNSVTIPKQRSLLFFGFFICLCIFFLCLFTALGVWQVKRLAWKNDLISHLNERLHLPATQAPMPAQWGNVSFDRDEYRLVTIKGQFSHDKEILVSTIADDTMGYWVLTPLTTDEGAIVFINRGFIPVEKKERTSREIGNPSDTVTITGLLRMSESDGFFPRKNNPEKNIWYSRQLPAMATKLDLSHVAPFFIDADKTANEGGFPIGGLTVVSYRNNHLNYAITWFVLAIGVLAAGIFLVVDKRKNRNI